MSHIPNTTCWLLAQKSQGMDILRNGIEGEHLSFGFGVELIECEQAAMTMMETHNADASRSKEVLIEVELPCDQLREIPSSARERAYYADQDVIHWVRIIPGEKWTPRRAMQDPEVGLVMELSIERIRDRACPFSSPPWRDCDERVTEEMVEQALADDHLISNPTGNGPTVDAWTHAGRIAWLIRNGWEDMIEIDVGAPQFDSRPRDVWPITDGNHRLFAAIMRGDETIFATVGGDLAVIDEMRVDVEPEIETVRHRP